MNRRGGNKRILLIDDNPSIHEDFKKILSPELNSRELETLRGDLFGDSGHSGNEGQFVVDSAFQGKDGLQRVRQACAAGQPYAMAFVDVRMPPGWDGIETMAHIWDVYPELQVVVCTAYSNYTLDEMIARLVGRTDRFVILKKPFDSVEVLQLANALTGKWQLAHELHEQLSQLEQMVLKRTAELSAANDRLAMESRRAMALAREAQQASRAKSEFLSVMSHELLTPLNGMSGMTSLLLDTELNAEQREFAETAMKCGQNLAVLVNDILDFANLDAGDESLEPCEFCLHQYMKDLVSELLPAGKAKGLLISYRNGPHVPAAVFGDGRKISQILRNLLSNAIKFTEKGAVELEVTVLSELPDSRKLRFEVRDSGIGIAPEVQRTLFEPFTQADSSTTRCHGGAGLGLAISAKLVQLMGGEIGVQSRPGAGSAFWFTVPLPTPPNAVDAASLRDLAHPLHPAA